MALSLQGTCAKLLHRLLTFFPQSPKGDRKPTGWSVPDPVYCLRTGDPVVDELVQGDALPRVYAKYGSIVQTIKEKIEAETDKRRKELLQKLITQVARYPQILSVIYLLLRYLVYRPGWMRKNSNERLNFIESM